MTMADKDSRSSRLRVNPDGNKASISPSSSSRISSAKRIGSATAAKASVEYEIQPLPRRPSYSSSLAISRYSPLLRSSSPLLSRTLSVDDEYQPTGQEEVNDDDEDEEEEEEGNETSGDNSADASDQEEEEEDLISFGGDEDDVDPSSPLHESRQQLFRHSPSPNHGTLKTIPEGQELPQPPSVHVQDVSVEGSESSRLLKVRREMKVTMDVPRSTSQSPEISFQQQQLLNASDDSDDNGDEDPPSSDHRMGSTRNSLRSKSSHDNISSNIVHGALHRHATQTRSSAHTLEVDPDQLSHRGSQRGKANATSAEPPTNTRQGTGPATQMLGADDGFHPSRRRREAKAQNRRTTAFSRLLSWGRKAEPTTEISDQQQSLNVSVTQDTLASSRSASSSQHQQLQHQEQPSEEQPEQRRPFITIKVTDSVRSKTNADAANATGKKSGWSLRRHKTKHKGEEGQGNVQGAAVTSSNTNDTSVNSSAHDVDHNQKVETPRYFTEEEIQRYMAAYSRMEDAKQGRDEHGILYVQERGRLATAFFNIRNSKAYEYLFVSVVFMHLVIAYFEDVRTKTYWALSVIPVVFYAFDAGMKMHYMSPKAFISKRWNQVHIICTLLFFIDFLLLLQGQLQVFRLLRPWIYLSKDKELRRFFQALLAIRGTIATLLLYVSLYVLFFASMAVHLFDEIYSKTCLDEQSVNFTGAFDNVLVAFVHMFVLATSENYPDVMLPAFRYSWSGFLFFGLFVLLALFYVLPMALALVNDAFWRAQGLQWKKDRKKERKTLIKAFNILDVNSVGWLTLEQWCDFMTVVRPQLPRSAHELTYQLACAGKPVLDWENFLEITNVLKAKLKARRSELRAVSDRLKPLQLRIHRLVRSDAWNTFICTLACIHWFAFCLKWEGRPESFLLVIKVVQTFNVIVFITEIGLKVFTNGWDFERDASVFKISVHALEYVSVLASTIGVVLYWAGSCADGACAIIGGAFQILRLAYRFKSNLTFLQTVEGILEISFKLIAIIAFMMFSYSALAFEMYRDVPPFFPYYCVSEFAADTCAIVNDTTAGNFDTLSCSSFVMFQMFTTSNWHELMSHVAENRTPWDSLFFISLYVMMQVILMSLMVGTSIEAFFLIRENKTKASKEKKTSEKKDPSTAGKDKRKRNFFTTVQRLSLFTRKRKKDRPDSVLVNVAPAETADVDESHDHAAEERRRKLEQRKMERKMKRKEKQSGKLPSRCVAIVNEKMHMAGDLPLVKGDVIDILDQKDGRYKGKCRGRAGWFDAKCVLVVLDEDMINALEQNTDVKYEFNLHKAHLAQATDDFLIMNSGVSRRDMVSDKITNMNADELIELNNLAKANLFARGFKKLANTPLRNNKVAPTPAESGTATPVNGRSPAPSRRAHISTSTPTRASESVSINSKAKALAASFLEQAQHRHSERNEEHSGDDGDKSKSHEESSEHGSRSSSEVLFPMRDTSRERQSQEFRRLSDVPEEPTGNSSWDKHRNRVKQLLEYGDAGVHDTDTDNSDRSHHQSQQDAGHKHGDQESLQLNTLNRAAKLAAQVIDSTPSKSAMKSPVASTTTSMEDFTDTSRTGRKKVLFAESVKKQDGSRKDMVIAQQKERAKADGKPPEWLESFLQKKNVRVIEGKLAPKPASPPRRSSLAERPGTPHSRPSWQQEPDSSSPQEAKRKPSTPLQPQAQPSLQTDAAIPEKDRRSVEEKTAVKADKVQHQETSATEVVQDRPALNADTPKVEPTEEKQSNMSSKIAPSPAASKPSFQLSGQSQAMAQFKAAMEEKRRLAAASDQNTKDKREQSTPPRKKDISKETETTTKQSQRNTDAQQDEDNGFDVLARINQLNETLDV
eukprot:m.132621 g.132621  ORF g.132621 m.132621 type:complete len:1844 (+) comp15779_c0_seq1:152-5683(+)